VSEMHNNSVDLKDCWNRRIILPDSDMYILQIYRHTLSLHTPILVTVFVDIMDIRICFQSKNLICPNEHISIIPYMAIRFLYCT
jgi:hypothetical protein